MQSITSYIIEAFNNAKRGDEFYTKMKDIENELKNYDFSEKTIYCCCDNPEFSNFYKYFKENFKSLKIKKLIVSFFGQDSYIEKYDGVRTNRYQNEYNGDFTKQDKLFEECDVVVTNPSFSNDYPTKLINKCIENHKKFVIIIPLMAYTKKNLFSLYKEGKFDISENSINSFYGPNDKTDLNASCIWATNFDISDRKRIIKLESKYNDSDYPKIDNYDAILVDDIKNIPKDYKGNMAVSVRFAQKLSKKQFSIVDVIRPIIDGKKIFMKLIIKLN